MSNVYLVVQGDYDCHNVMACFTEKADAETYLKSITEFMSSENGNYAGIQETVLNPTIVNVNQAVKLEQLFIDYFPNLIISESKSYSIEGSYSKKTESNYYTLYIQYETKNNSWHSELSFAPFDSAFPLCQHSNLDTFMQETKAKLAALFLDMYNQIK
jgi:hypothetical protein